MCSGSDPVSSMFNKRPSIQDNSTLNRETRRKPTTERDSSNGRDSIIDRRSVRHTKDVRVDSVTSESTRYIEEILNSKRQKSKLVSRYVIVTFILTNCMLVGFSILGSIIIIPQINPCICPPSAPRTTHHYQDYAQRPTGSESPVLSQTQTQDHDQTSQGTETSQDKTRQENVDKDYSIFIRVEEKNNTSHDDFWNDV